MVFFSLRLPKKRGSRGEKRPFRPAIGHETERGLEFSAKGGGVRRKSGGQMLKSCGLFAESRLLFVETRALFSISPHTGGNRRRKSAKCGDPHLASGEQIGKMRSSCLPFFLFAARSRHKKALPPLEKAVTGRELVGLCVRAPNKKTAASRKC